MVKNLKTMQRFLLAAVLTGVVSLLFNLIHPNATPILLEIELLEKIGMFVILGLIFISLGKEKFLEFKKTSSIIIFSLTVALSITILEVFSGVVSTGIIFITKSIGRTFMAFIGINLSKFMIK